MKRKIELLAPARDAETAIAAIDHGADAVYMGGPSHGARHAAVNSVGDIRRVCDYAHRFGVRVYVTLNTLVYDGETEAVAGLARELYDAGVDALIVQDMALAEMTTPPIELHASTQCDIREPSRARFLADAGFARLVLARELSLGEIGGIAREVPSTEIESFVHGALCVSYSGDCRASFVTTGRSANRGECAQICRLEFDLTDREGHTLVRGKHLLSLRDMNRAERVGEMIDAGVTSFKIEGRLKDAAYVKNTVAAYRRVLDAAIAERADRCERSSFGRSEVSFEPNLDMTFNRGFTNYFLDGGRGAEAPCVGSPETSKMTGRPVAVTTSPSRGNAVFVRPSEPIANGDGLGWFGPSGRFEGFRVNRVADAGRKLLAAKPVEIGAGTTLYRNRDKVWDDALGGETGRRVIGVRMTLRTLPFGIALDVEAPEAGKSVSVTVTCDEPLAPARTPQSARRRDVLTKTGATVYEVEDVDDRLGDLFVAVSQLADLRRRALTALDRAIAMGHQRRLRQDASPKATDAPALTESMLPANRLARRFYEKRGVKITGMALETRPESERRAPGQTVMTTRYCLRRELGACLRSRGADRLPRELYLHSERLERPLKLDFDCARCQMRVVTV